MQIKSLGSKRETGQRWYLVTAGSKQRMFEVDCVCYTHTRSIDDWVEPVITMTLPDARGEFTTGCETITFTVRLSMDISPATGKLIYRATYSNYGGMSARGDRLNVEMPWGANPCYTVLRALFDIA